MSLTKEEKLQEILKEYECKFHQFPSMDNPHGCTDCYNTGYILDNPEIHMLVEYDRENANLKYQLKEIADSLLLNKEELKEEGFFGRACSRLLNKNKESREVLLSFIRQDTNRGYPTGKEWNNLIREVSELLSKYPDSK